MTKEEIFQSYIEDPLLVEKSYLSEERAKTISIVDSSSIKIIEVIKIAIHSCVDGETENVTARKLNQYLNNR